MARVLLPLMLILLFWGIIGLTQVPREITYQGYLTDNSSNPVTANLQLTFNIYNTQSGGSTLWTEIHPSIAVIEGVFRARLGSITSLNLAFDTPYWLGITVESDPELAPRIVLTGVGYSFFSLKADSVNNLSDGSVTTAKIEDGAVTQLKLAPGVSLPPGGMAGGDLGGSYPNPTVLALQGNSVSSNAPASGQVLKWAGSAWTPDVDNTGTSVWTSSGNDIYNSNSGNVGIGVATPTEKLDVDGMIKTDNGFTIGSDSNGVKITFGYHTWGNIANNVRQWLVIPHGLSEAFQVIICLDDCSDPSFQAHPSGVQCMVFRDPNNNYVWNQLIENKSGGDRYIRTRWIAIGRP